MDNLSIGFLGGLFSFAHCIGMCGGFALHLAQHDNRRRMLASQLMWLTGKGFTYIFFGSLAGYAGAFLGTTLLKHGHFLDTLSIGAGVMILLMGIMVLGFLPVPGGKSENTFLSGICRIFVKTTNPAGAFFLGLTTGWLPCPIVLALLAYALQTGSVLKGMVTMAGLALGSTVPLLMLGSAAAIGGTRMRVWGAKTSGVILLILGFTTLLRGTEIYHQVLGCSTKAVQGLQPAIKPCCSGKNHANGSH